MSTEALPSYEFGPFRLDRIGPFLWRAGGAVSVTPKALQTLVVLVESGGRVVTRNELIEAVWPDTVVEENNLSVNISMLRKALGEGEGGAKYIETVPRRGYRFVAPVRRIEIESPELFYERRTEFTNLIESAAAPEVPPIVVTKSAPDVTSTAANPNVTVTSLVPPKSRLHKLTSRPVLFTILVVAALAGGTSFVRLRLQRGTTPGHRAAGTSGASDSVVRSLAVLPLSGDSSGDFGASTMDTEVHDTVFARLNAAGNVSVAPQGAVLASKMTRNNMLLAGRALQADAVLSVCVLRNDDTEGIILRLHLVSVNGGEVLWADTVSRRRSELAVLADIVARNVLDGLQRLRSAEEYEQRARRHTTNREAYQHYLQGRFLWEQRKDVFARNYVIELSGPVPSINQLEQARALDPNFALAYVGLADHYKTYDYSGGDWRRGEEYAVKAIALDANLAEAHATLAFIRMFHYWDWAGAEAEFKRALELDAACVTAHQWYALFHALRGNRRESVIEITRARELAPYSISIQIDSGQIQYFALGSVAGGQVGEAIEPLRHILSLLDSNTGEPGNSLSDAYWMAGYYEAAIEYDKSYTGLRSQQDYTRYKVEQCKGSREYDDLPERETWNCARWVAQMNQRDAALGLLERAYRYHHFSIIYLKAEPFLKDLRGEPRFQALLQKLGLPASTPSSLNTGWRRLNHPVTK